MSENLPRRGHGEVTNGEQRRGHRGVAASNGSPLLNPRRNGEPNGGATPSSLITLEYRITKYYYPRLDLNIHVLILVCHKIKCSFLYFNQLKTFDSINDNLLMHSVRLYTSKTMSKFGYYMYFKTNKALPLR